MTISSISAAEVTINDTTEGGIKNAISNGSTTINLENGTYEGDNNVDIYINKGQNITISGIDSNNKPIISLKNTQSTWFIQNYGNLTLINLVIKDSFVNGLGGALINGGNLTVVNCTFINTSSAYGGAIHSLNNSNLIIINSIFNKTDAYQMGGAISIDNGAIAIIRWSEFINNKARTHGGAIYNNGILYLDSTNSFVGNTADESNDIYNTGSIYSMPILLFL